MRRSGIGWLVALGALGWIVVGSVNPAQGYADTLPPWYYCFNDSQVDLAVLERSLSPANDASVPAGTPVTFSGNSGAPVTFAVASSPGLLPSPDIDSGGLGSVRLGTSPSTYTLISAKASATPRTVYWDASFSNATLEGCAGLTPTTYTTHARALMVLPSPAEEAAAAAKKKQEEEEVASKKKQEEEAAAAAVTGSVSLDGSTITVLSSGEALVKLTCGGTGTCSGKLTLTAKSTPKKGKKPKTETIGTASFSIPARKTATGEFKLNGAGRALLSAVHGRLSATLTILKSLPTPSQTHTENVRLLQRKATKARHG